MHPTGFGRLWYGFAKAAINKDTYTIGYLYGGQLGEASLVLIGEGAVKGTGKVSKVLSKGKPPVVKKALKKLENKSSKKLKKSKALRNIAKYGEDFGKMGTYVKNPNIKINWSAFAEHASKRIQQRGMSKKSINKIVKRGKALSQNNGNKFAFVTKNGVVVMSKEGKLITAWGKEYFDNNMKQIVRRLYGGK